METKAKIIIAIVVILIIIAIFIILFITLRHKTNIKAFGGYIDDYKDDNGIRYSINSEDNVANILKIRFSRNVIIDEMNINYLGRIVDYIIPKGLCENNGDLESFIITNNARIRDIYPEAMFKRCSSLKTVKLGKYNTNHTIFFPSTFEWCTNLKSIDLSGWSGPIGSLDNTFSNCRTLEEIKFGDIYDKFPFSGDHTFSDCYNLKSLDLSKFNVKHIVNAIGMFKDCSKNTRFDIGDNIILGDNFDLKECSTLRQMFYGCPLREFNILDLYSDAKKLDQNNYEEMCKYIKTIKTDDIEEMFRECEYLNLIDLRLFNNFPTKSSINIFYKCGSLTEIDGDTLTKDKYGKLIPAPKKRGDMHIIIANTNILNIFNKYSTHNVANYKAIYEYYYDVNCDNSFHS